MLPRYSGGDWMIWVVAELVDTIRYAGDAGQSAGASTSQWMILASGAKAMIRPVTRSSNRVEVGAAGRKFYVFRRGGLAGDQAAPCVNPTESATALSDNYSGVSVYLCVHVHVCVHVCNHTYGYIKYMYVCLCLNMRILHMTSYSHIYHRVNVLLSTWLVREDIMKLCICY